MPVFEEENDDIQTPPASSAVSSSNSVTSPVSVGVIHAIGAPTWIGSLTRVVAAVSDSASQPASSSACSGSGRPSKSRNGCSAMISSLSEAASSRTSSGLPPK